MKSLVTALLMGLLASLVLFWLMQAMIMPDAQAVKKTEKLHRVEFVRLKREPPAPEKKPKPPEKNQPPEPVKAAARPKPPVPKKAPKPKKVQPKTPPPKPVPDLPKLDLAAPAKASTDAQTSVPPTAAASQPRPDKPAQAEAGAGISSNVVALVRIPPKYPPRAANRRIQGWVKIEFTITRTGTVKDAVVVEAQPNSIFNKVALEAINKWKFKEKLVDGAPVEQRAVQVLQFKLAK